MLDSNVITKFSGPPGTGKSTTLLNAVDRLLGSGVAPEDIVFTTFTRAGADEARNRACVRFNLSPNRFTYFRTLHSICYSLLPKREIMRWNDWAEIGRTLGIYFTTRYSPEEPIPRGQTKGDYLMSLWSLARVMRKSPEETFKNRTQWLMGFEGMEFREFEHFITSVQSFKEAKGRIDFTDMLEEYLVHGPLIRPHACIIDEAQDLSFIQWEVANKLCTGAKEVLVAGDDDQCIHEWNGAFPKGFIDLQSRTYSVLPQSYRIPSTVHTMAENVIKQVQLRLPKTYLPREDAGTVERVDGLHQADLSKGTWLLLARNLTFLDEYADHCRKQGLLWSSQSVPCLDESIINAIAIWKQLRTTELSVTQVRVIYKYLSSGDRVSRGFKKKLDSLPDDLKLSHQSLVNDYGLLAARDLDWNTALDAIPPEEKSFLLAVERREGLGAKPRIEIGTIHSAKGKEADHVLLNPNMTHRTAQAFDLNPDAEHRVWYVGVTRARHSLHILNPSTERSYAL